MLRACGINLDTMNISELNNEMVTWYLDLLATKGYATRAPRLAALLEFYRFINREYRKYHKAFDLNQLYLLQENWLVGWHKAGRKKQKY